MRLASNLTPGAVLLIYGDLGTGKTVFVRGLAQGLEFSPDEVSSPTFTIVQEYHGGRLPLYHVDLYRLASPDVDDLGLEDIAADGVLAVEWAERLPRPIHGAIEVWLQDTGGDERVITISGTRA